MYLNTQHVIKYQTSSTVSKKICVFVRCIKYFVFVSVVYTSYLIIS